MIQGFEGRLKRIAVDKENAGNQRIICILQGKCPMIKGKCACTREFTSISTRNAYVQGKMLVDEGKCLVLA